MAFLAQSSQGLEVVKRFPPLAECWPRFKKAVSSAWSIGPREARPEMLLFTGAVGRAYTQLYTPLMIIIEMIYKECNYQKLCFQVADIHRIIAEKTQYRWRLDGFKRVWHRFICPNVSAFLATFLIAIMVFIGKDFNMKSFLPNVIICIIPSLLSIVSNCKKNRT